MELKKVSIEKTRSWGGREPGLIFNDPLGQRAHLSLTENKSMSRIRFDEFLNREAEQVEISIKLLGDDLRLFYDLDYLILSPLDRISNIAINDRIILFHYQFVHFHFYISHACLLRCHLAESLASSRKAIDASLTIYRFLEEPKSVEEFLATPELPSSFRDIKRYMQGIRRESPAKFALAAEILEMHGSFSALGAHADPAGMYFRRTRIEEIEDQNILRFSFDYFQRPQNLTEFRRQFALMLITYLRIQRILKLFLDRNIRTIDPEWERRYEQFQRNLEELRLSVAPNATSN